MFVMSVRCTTREFDAYWYGIGTLVLVEPLTDDPEGRKTFVVNYDDDAFRAQYQADRFGSGLIFAKVSSL